MHSKIIINILLFMIDRPILHVLLNNVEKLCAYDIFASYRMLSFCTSPDKEPEVYNIFGFCIERLTSYNFKTYIFYVIS